MSSRRTRLCKNSDVELARRKFVSIALNEKRSDLPVTVGRRKESKQFCAVSARARCHTAWHAGTHNHRRLLKQKSLATVPKREATAYGSPRARGRQFLWR